MHKNAAMLELLNGSDQMIQVSHRDSYAMLYANAAAQHFGGQDRGPYEGRCCYEYLMGLDSPCAFCPLAQQNGQDSFRGW